MYSHADSKVFFIAVWDTVGALGIPNDLPGWKELSELFTGWEQLWGFHDTRLSLEVRFAYHALAIDEERSPYKPTLWTEDADAVADQHLEQVWFAGVHSEVGGGTSDPSLSDIPSLWMAAKAGAQGLMFKDGQPEAGVPALTVPAPAPKYAAAVVQSRRGVWEALDPYHRLRDQAVVGAPEQWVASSADRRFNEKIGGYAPPGFAEFRANHEVQPVTRNLTGKPTSRRSG